MTPTVSNDLISGLAALRENCEDLRFGQMLATLGMLAEGMYERNLWDIEDDQLGQVIQKFHDDMARRDSHVNVD